MSISESLPPAQNPEQFKENFYVELHNRTRNGMRQKAESGEFPGCAPVGYLNVWKDGKKTIVIDSVKAPLIREAFRMAAQNKLSLREILKIVTDKGLTSRNGKSPGVSALWGILTNPFYVGRIRYNGYSLTGVHMSIVDIKLFSKVQENLTERSKS
jgi:hypothetical protein